MLAKPSPVRLSTGLLAGILLVAAAPLGSVEPWVEASLRAAAGLALVLTVALEPIAGPLHRVRWTATALAGIGLLGLLQGVPLPGWLLRWVSPAHWRWANDAEPVAGGAVWSALSVAPAESLEAGLDWLAVAALFVCGASAGISRRRRRVLGGAFLAAVVLQVLYGGRQFMVGAREIWGVFVQSQPQRFKGTFVNPNHAALYLVLGLALLVAGALWSIRQARRRRLSNPSLAVMGLSLTLAVLVAGAIAATGSRAGLLAAGAAGVVALWAWTAPDGKRRWIWPVAIGLVLAVGVLALWLTGGSGALGRLASTRLDDSSFGVRLEALCVALRLVPSFPVTGVGLGGFEDAFRTVATPELAAGSWAHLHNDPVELWITGGLVALALGLVGAVTLLRRLWQVARFGEASEDRAAGVFGLSAVAGLCILELLEFGLTNPANAATAATLLGAAATSRIASPQPRPDA